jgi:hypothetical protein
LRDDADNIRRDAATHRVFVGYGSGGIAVFDLEGNKVGDVKLMLILSRFSWRETATGCLSTCLARKKWM